MDGFGERLVNARKNKGYNQKQFAELLEITPTRLNYWEKDKREPDFFMLKKIIDLLKIDSNELLGLDCEKKHINELILTDKEKQLITNFRSLSKQGQEYILQTMDMVKDRYKKDDNISDLEEKLS